MTRPLRFNSVDDIRRAIDATGSHWFSAATMRFFRTRLSTTVYGGRFFITSEQNWSGERAYSVREVYREDDGSLSIRTAEGTEFHGIPTRARAVTIARRVARERRDSE